MFVVNETLRWNLPEQQAMRSAAILTGLHVPTGDTISETHSMQSVPLECGALEALGTLQAFKRQAEKIWLLPVILSTWS